MGQDANPLGEPFKRFEKSLSFYSNFRRGASESFQLMDGFSLFQSRGDVATARRTGARWAGSWD